MLIWSRCANFLPGPASSQVGMAIGIARAGLPGALAAWLGFTLPSALLLIVFAFGVDALGTAATAGWLHGLKVVAVAVVAQAVWGMAKSLCPDRQRATLAIVAAIVTLSWPTAAGQLRCDYWRGYHRLVISSAGYARLSGPRAVSREQTRRRVRMDYFFRSVAGPAGDSTVGAESLARCLR